MVYMCKMIISPGVFSNFDFDFLGCQWGERVKLVSKWWKILSVAPFVSGTIEYMIYVSYSVSQELSIIRLWFLVYMCKMMISPAIFIIFFKILIFYVFNGGESAKNYLKLPISVCHTLYLRNCRSYHQGLWYTGVK